MKIIKTYFLLLLFFASAIGSFAQDETNERAKWFTGARCGMFIHWGGTAGQRVFGRVRGTATETITLNGFSMETESLFTKGYEKSYRNIFSFFLIQFHSQCLRNTMPIRIQFQDIFCF